jgi:FkbM family methyltransferase
MSAGMTEQQNAVLWWRQLFTELGSAAHTGDKDMLGQIARHRSWAVANLFFTISEQMQLRNLLEIGAHNAESSRRFVKDNPNARAFAYEASEEVFNRTMAAGISDRMEMFNCAVGAKNGEITFFVPKSERLQVWGSTRRRAGNVDTVEVTVPIITLDEAANRIANYSNDRDIAMWVDVEGSGYDVIKGGHNSLKDRVSLIYIEMNDVETYEGSATALNILEELLYFGFVPVARDNQFHDAWNLLVAHQTTYKAAQALIADWTYKYSRFVSKLSATPSDQ